MVPLGATHNPSPMAYDIPSKMIEGPKSAMHRRCDNLDINKKNNYPGTGSYELQNMSNLNQKRSQRYSIGKETRDRSTHFKEQAMKPGAGTYDGTLCLKRSSPRFGFGTSKRPAIGYQKDNSPGPGTYKVPT